MNCDEVRELLPACALGLLDADDHEAVEVHLRGCREHDAELVELRATSFALDMLREETPYSPALPQSIGRIAAGPPTNVRRIATSRPRWWLPAAAVVALFVMFGAGWLAHATFEGSPTVAHAQYSYALQGADGQFVSFMGAEGSDRVTVKMAGLERLSDGQLYRLWAIRDGQWVRIGQCNTNQQGGWDGDFAFALDAGEELAVTVEKPSADPQPHGTPILHSQQS